MKNRFYRISLSVFICIIILANMIPASASLTLEEYIASEIENLETVIDVSSYNCNKDDLEKAYATVRNSNPMLFYMTHRCEYTSVGDTVKELEMTYMFSDAQIANMTAEINAEVDRIIKKITTPNMNDYQKELAIFDYVVTHVTYDTAEPLHDLSYTVYGALIDGVAICEGYSRAIQLLLGKCNIPSILVEGYAGENHMWNLVQIDGKWYHVDATWADGSFVFNGSPVPDNILYTYFNTTSSFLSAKGRTWITELPYADNAEFGFLRSAIFVKHDDIYFYYTFSEGGDTYDSLYKTMFGSEQSTRVKSGKIFYTTLHNDKIYFSDYNYGAYLRCMNKDGSGEKTLLNYNCRNLRVVDNKLYYEYKNQQSDTTFLSDFLVIDDNNLVANKIALANELQTKIQTSQTKLSFFTKLENPGDSIINGRVFVASYTESGALCGLHFEDFSVPVKDYKYFYAGDIDLPAEAESVKFMFFNNLIPLCAYQTYQRVA